MAKETEDREDLLRDGTQFARRLELEILRDDNPPLKVFCGFRDNDAFSVYWGQDTVVQFNTNDELRRAFWRDQMIATYKHKLHWLKSENAGRVQLKRVLFTDKESEEFDGLARQILKELETVLNSLSSSEQAKVTGQFPADDDVISEVRRWIAATNSAENGIEYAMHPGVGKKAT